MNRMQIFAPEQKVSRTENHEALELVNFHGSDNWTKKSEKSKRERMQSLYITNEFARQLRVKFMFT